MKTNTAPAPLSGDKSPSEAPTQKPRKPARYAAHIGETDSWLDVAAPSLTEAERLHATYSAAPELLAALDELLASYVSLVNSGDAGSWNPETDAKVKAARAAIAKAKGVTL